MSSELHHTCNEAFRIAAPTLQTSNRTAPVGADRAVIPTHDEALRRDVLKRISAIGANLQHATVEAEVGIHIRRLKIKIVAEPYPRDEPLENSDICRIEAFVADYRRIINEHGIRWCISRRHRHPEIRSDP
jgi:hypothetical protein